jgi:hypothetical protein
LPSKDGEFTELPALQWFGHEGLGGESGKVCLYL